MRVLAAAWPGAASPVQVARPGLAQAGLEELPGADIAVKCCSASAGVLWYGTACCGHCPCCPQGCMPCVNLQLLSPSCCWMGPCASSQAFLCCSLCRDVVCHQELSVRALGVTAIRPSIRTTAGRPPPTSTSSAESDTVHYRCAPEFQLTSPNAMYLQVVFIHREYLLGQWSCSAEHSIVFFWVLSVGNL